MFVYHHNLLQDQIKEKCLFRVSYILNNDTSNSNNNNNNKKKKKKKKTKKKIPVSLLQVVDTPGIWTELAIFLP